MYFWLYIDCKMLEGRDKFVNSFVFLNYSSPMSNIHSCNKYLLSTNSVSGNEFIKQNKVQLQSLESLHLRHIANMWDILISINYIEFLLESYFV